MRILVAHNRYQQRGGEDVVFENEVKLLAASGHDVDTLVVSNDAIVSLFDKALTALRTAKNPAGTAAMALAIDRFRPDIVHVHNFFPLLSPAIYQDLPAGGNCGCADASQLQAHLRRRSFPAKWPRLQFVPAWLSHLGRGAPVLPGLHYRLRRELCA